MGEESAPAREASRGGGGGKRRNVCRAGVIKKRNAERKNGRVPRESPPVATHGRREFERG